MKIMKILTAGIMLTWITSCSDYLDIVPDNVATIEYAFRMRSTAEQYLFTCYSFIPKLGTIHQHNPALFGRMSSGSTRRCMNSPVVDCQGLQNVNTP